jgi:hypothetical protein
MILMSRGEIEGAIVSVTVVLPLFKRENNREIF